MVGQFKFMRIVGCLVLACSKTFLHMREDLIFVNQLQTPSGGWNISLIKTNFCAEDVAMISSIPQSNSVTEDSVVWHYEKNGEYTVRSGYKVAMMNGQVTSSSGLGGCNTSYGIRFGSLVSLDPGKIKVFIWRACHQWILSLVSLERRGIQVEWLCPRCNRKPDTISHALWGCSKLKEIRKASKIVHQSSGLDPGILVNWCRDYLEFQNANAQVAGPVVMRPAAAIKW